MVQTDTKRAGVDRLLKPDATAHLLGVSDRTLKRYRETSTGPLPTYLSPVTVRYSESEVRRFIAERTGYGKFVSAS